MDFNSKSDENVSSFLELPNEIHWKILFDSFYDDKFVLNATDLTNISLVSKELKLLMRPKRTTYLFEKVFNIIQRILPERDLFKCRPVCRRWKQVLDKYIKDEGYTEDKRYNPYTVLGIRVGSNAAVVRRAILQKLKIHHPDRGGSHSECLKVLKSRDILSDPDYRQCFNNCHESPYHLKLAWMKYQKIRAENENMFGQQSSSSDSESEEFGSSDSESE